MRLTLLSFPRHRVFACLSVLPIHLSSAPALSVNACLAHVFSTSVIIHPFLADEMVAIAVHNAVCVLQPPGLSTGSLFEPPAKTGAATARPLPTLAINREMCLTAVELAALKTNATLPDGHFRVSTLSASCTHFWRLQHVAHLALACRQAVLPEVSPVFLTSVNHSTKFFPDERTPLHYLSNALMVPFINLGTSILEEFATWALWFPPPCSSCRLRA